MQELKAFWILNFLNKATSCKLAAAREKYSGNPKQTIGNGKTNIADDAHIVSTSGGRATFNRGKINDSKLSAQSSWTENQKSELIDRFRNNANLEYIEFEIRSNNSFLQ